MPSKAIRIDLEVITELDKLRPLSPSSYSSIILKLLRSHRELTRIEQFAMSGKDSTSAMIKLNHEPILANKPNHTQIKPKSNEVIIHTKIKPLSKNEPKLLLFCFECQEQTPHKKLRTKQKLTPIDLIRQRDTYKCSICGAKRNV